MEDWPFKKTNKKADSSTLVKKKGQKHTTITKLRNKTWMSRKII